MLSDNMLDELEQIEKESEEILKKAYKKRDDLIRKGMEKLTKEKEERIKEAEKEIKKIRKETDNYIQSEVKKYEKNYEKRYARFKEKLHELENDLPFIALECLEELLDKDQVND